MTSRGGVANQEQLTQFQDVTTQAVVAAGVDPSAAPFIAGKAGYTIYVRKIIANITTSVAQTLTFRDDASTPVVCGVVMASIGVGSWDIADYGEEGFALTEGKDLDLVASAAGYAGTLWVSAYLRLTGVVTPAQL